MNESHTTARTQWHRSSVENEDTDDRQCRDNEQQQTSARNANIEHSYGDNSARLSITDLVEGVWNSLNSVYPEYSEKDSIVLCYVGDQPWNLTKRMGSERLIPSGSTSGQIIVSTVQPGPYRAVYVDGITNVFVAASDICYIFPKPAVASFFSTFGQMQRRPEPQVVLHPQFRLLTENPADFKLPIPPYFNVNFQLNSRATQIALQVDPQLAKIRLDLVPTYIEDEEFWKNYFYRMVLLDTSSTTTTSYSKKTSQQEMKETKTRSSSSSSSTSTSNNNSPTKTNNLSSDTLNNDSTVITEVVYTEL